MALEAVITIVTSLLDNIDMLIEAAIQLIMGLADGLIMALPILIEKIPIIIQKLIDAIIRNLPKLVKMGIQLVVKLAAGLIQAIPQLIAAIPQLIWALLDGLSQLPGMMWDIGCNIVRGIWQGIQSLAGWLWRQVKNFASNILNNVKSALGIHSPSRLFKDQVGKNIALGVGEGFEDNISKIYDKMRASVNFETQKLSAKLSTTASFNKSLRVNINQTKSDVIMEGRKVGQIITPYVRKTVKVGGI